MTLKSLNVLTKNVDFSNVVLGEMLINKPNLNLVVLVDSSGSTTKEQENCSKQFLLKLKDSLFNHESFKLAIWKFDNMIIEESVKEFTQDNIEEIFVYDVSSTYGGTDLSTSMKKINKLYPDTDLIIVLTDGQLDLTLTLHKTAKVLYALTPNQYSTDSFFLNLEVLAERYKVGFVHYT